MSCRRDSRHSRSLGRNPVSPEFPIAIATLRRSPESFARFTGEPKKAPRKARFIQPRQPFEGRIHQLSARLKLRIVADRRLPVPWANILADIAAKDLPPYLRPQISRNLAPLFNRQIGDAKPRIHLVRSGERPRRTSVDAAPAASAPVRRNFSDSPWWQLQSKSR